MAIRYAFLGTPEFAAIILGKLIVLGIPPDVLICNPDKPRGRKNIVTPPAAKIVAEKHGIKVWQPEKLTKDEWILNAHKVDFGVVASYGKIIPKDILSIPRFGFIGVHPSLLPKYRGPSPIQTVILNGEKQTGVTLFLADEKVDHGPILVEQALYEPIDDLYYGTLLQKLANLAGEMLAGFLPEFIKDEVAPRKQHELEATYTKKFAAKDAFVDLEKDAPENIWKKVRALNPEPGAWTIWYGGKPFDKAQGKRMKILEANLVSGKLVLKKIQFEGKKPQTIP